MVGVYVRELDVSKEVVFTICLTCEQRAVGFRTKRSLQDEQF